MFYQVMPNKGVFYENKTAKGLLDIAEATRTTVNGSQTIPSLEEIKDM